MQRFITIAMAVVGLSSAAANGQNGPVPPRDAAAKMTAPAGFKVTLFAGEPDVVQPIAFTYDDRGRLWVVENHSYPGWNSQPHDRVLIFEDRDGDGKFDVKTVFLSTGRNLSGIVLGRGGVWLCSTPELVFIPDANRDDVPDGPARVVLDGWDLNAKHNVFNSLTWGPDGWLYGCNGITSNSLVGKPGTPKNLRTPLNCSVWRFHPVREVFEVVTHGTTNPWGLDFDDFGQMFITNCVIEHAWHAIPGANLKRMFGQPFNPNLYELMSSPVDHVHWDATQVWSDIRSTGVTPVTDGAGGGHAHSGGMIYLGENFPAEYRNSLFTCNIHGNRVNRDLLVPSGSSYVVKHAPDFLKANDPWFRGLSVQYGPDGAVYVADWSDTGECHNYVEVDRGNGRIFKVSYAAAPGAGGPFDMNALADDLLVTAQSSRNEWVVRHARRILTERAGQRPLADSAVAALKRLAINEGKETVRLRAIWTMYSCGLLTEANRLALLDDVSPWVRSWAVRLAVDAGTPNAAILTRFAALAGSDRSPVVRLALASALQRLPVASRWEIAAALVARVEDAADPTIAHMLWYAVEPMVAADPSRALKLLASSNIPLVRRFIARRYTALTSADPQKAEEFESLFEVALALSLDGPPCRDLLNGVLEGLVGRRRVALPRQWRLMYGVLNQSPHPEVRNLATRVALVFGDEVAFSTLRARAADEAETADARVTAINDLVAARDVDLIPILQRSLADKPIQAAALHGLAAIEHPDTPRVILAAYRGLDADGKADAVATLASRPAWAVKLLEAVGKGEIPRSDLSPAMLQALAGHADPAVKAAVAALGSIRPTPAAKKATIERLKRDLTPETLARADRSHGRAVFARNCASCHTLFDSGGKVGPELTGSQRTNLDYVLSNVVDPSAVVARDYQVVVFDTRDGRVISGIVRLENDVAVTVQTATETIVLPKSEIESRRQTNVSLMPEGLLDPLSAADVRDLVGYLAGPGQPPLPASTGGR